MKTWRERIAEARERGYFTAEEYDLARDGNTCAVGEHWLQLGYTRTDRYIQVFYGAGNPGETFLGAVGLNDFVAADQILDQIEDLALQLKREATS